MPPDEKIINFESMFQSVTDTVKDMGDLKVIIESEIKNLRNDLYTIMKSYDVRITELERKVNVWEHVKFIGSGILFGALLTMVLLFIIGRI